MMWRKHWQIVSEWWFNAVSATKAIFTARVIVMIGLYLAFFVFLNFHVTYCVCRVLFSVFTFISLVQCNWWERQVALIALTTNH